MGNLSNSIKRFISNKNTVTILGVVIGIIVLYVGYQYRVSAALVPVIVPVANENLLPNSKITNDKLSTIKLSKEEADKIDNLYRNKSQIINKYVKYGYTIPKNGLFYIDNVIDASAKPNSIFADMPDGASPFSLPVRSVTDIDISYGNSIMPGDYIDLYLRAVKSDGVRGQRIYYGRLIRSLEVLAVRDSNGNDIFSGGVALKKPDNYVFALESSMHTLLTNALSIDSKGIAKIDLIPIPKNAKYSLDPENTTIANSKMVAYIESFTEPVSDEDPIEKE